MKVSLFVLEPETQSDTIARDVTGEEPSWDCNACCICDISKLYMCGVVEFYFFLMFCTNGSIIDQKLAENLVRMSLSRLTSNLLALTGWSISVKGFFNT